MVRRQAAVAAPRCAPPAFVVRSQALPAQPTSALLPSQPDRAPAEGDRHLHRQRRTVGIRVCVCRPWRCADTAGGHRPRLAGSGHLAGKAAVGSWWGGRGLPLPAIGHARAVAQPASHCRRPAWRVIALASLAGASSRLSRKRLRGRVAAATSWYLSAQVGQKVDVCQRGPANSAECQTLTTAGKS